MSLFQICESSLHLLHDLLVTPFARFSLHRCLAGERRVAPGSVDTEVLWLCSGFQAVREGY